MFAELNCKCSSRCGHFLKHGVYSPVPVIIPFEPHPNAIHVFSLNYETSGGLNCLGQPLSHICLLNINYVLDTKFFIDCPMKIY